MIVPCTIDANHDRIDLHAVVSISDRFHTGFAVRRRVIQVAPGAFRPIELYLAGIGSQRPPLCPT
jgi:hypothetical protein